MLKNTLMLALAIAFAAVAGIACGSTPTPPVNPQDRIQSTSPDDMPPTGTSGLGTPGDLRDAGLPHMPMDGAVPRGNGQTP